MRLTLASMALTAFAVLTGCASAPNEPTLTLETSKSPEQFAACVVPKLQSHSLSPLLSQTQRHYRITMSSSLAADNVIEAYKAGSGGKVFIYERSLLSSGVGQAAKDCV
ncbi:hypothetical protein ACIQAL_18415 [Pseudomonas sp. NPDC088368]|jgi:hypothetical protein|uniref:hypothetical protein n=1 Tax=unclassified Pseudomonas TaxID=196821 RepID=UPI0014122AFB|nr:hypothetical protein [Pseudomonas sp. SLFW]NBB09164.1 hypothetical protein [Pseudomonas sp. SLFW]